MPHFSDFKINDNITSKSHHNQQKNSQQEKTPATPAQKSTQTLQKTTTKVAASYTTNKRKRNPKTATALRLFQEQHNNNTRLCNLQRLTKKKYYYSSVHQLQYARMPEKYYSPPISLFLVFQMPKAGVVIFVCLRRSQRTDLLLQPGPSVCSVTLCSPYLICISLTVVTTFV